MTPELIIEQLAADGIRLSLADSGSLKAAGQQEAVSRWLPIIKEHKPGLVAALQAIRPGGSVQTGEMDLTPGQPVELPTVSLPDPIVIEPAHHTARPIFWERNDGRIYGPASPEFLAMVGTRSQASYWVVVAYQGSSVWVNADRLRTKKQFQKQHAEKGTACFACQSPRRWVSIHGTVVCGTCHPPVDDSLVKEWIGPERSGDGIIDADNAPFDVGPP